MKKTYKIKIEPLTPIHIGSGETITTLDYKLIKTKQGNTKYARFSSDKVLEGILGKQDKQKLAQFNKFVELKNMRNLQTFFHENLNNDSVLYLCDVSPEFERLYGTNLQKDPLENAMEVQTMYRPEGSSSPVIPGSSIKGSIRTALLTKMEKELGDKECERLQESEIGFNKPSRIKDTKVQKKLFGFSDAKNDPLRAVLVGDASFSGPGTQIVSVVRNSSVDEKSSELKPLKIQILVEAVRGILIDGVAQTDFRLQIDQNLQKTVINSPDPKKQFSIGNNCRFSIDDIRTACNDYYINHFNDEYDKFFQPCSKGLSIIDKLCNEVDQIQASDNSFLIRVGKFSQVDFITLEPPLQKPDSKGGKFGGTRNLMIYRDNFVPLGWCKCTICED